MSEPENPHLVCTGPGTGPGKDDGGKCFTLRDLFAAFALAGQLANGEDLDPAKWAYHVADQMLAEREKAS